MTNIQGNHFTRLFERNDSTLLIPFKGNQILLCQLENDNFKILETKDVNGEVFSISESSSGDSIWLGTSDGLKLIDSDFRIYSLLSNHWELGYSNIYSIQSDEKEGLWMSTNNGIWNYNIKENLLTRYGNNDGFETEEFSSNASLFSSENLLWLGHNSGLSFFDPDSINPFTFPPRPYIKYLHINNIPYKSTQFIGETKAISLEYFENSLVFTPVAIGYNHPEANKLRYRLLNHDSTWNVINNGDQFSFTKLTPNSYKLEIIAINKNGIESSPIFLSIKISPPFWQTWWFRLLFLTVIGGIIYGSIKSYIQRKLREKQIIIDRQKAVHEERIRISHDLHDDLGRELSAISSKCVDMIEGIDPSLKESLIKISSHANNALDNMEEILWILDHDFDFLENLIKKIETDIRKYTSDNGLELEFNLNSKLPEVELGGEFRSSLLRIFKEAVYNIVKHAKASKVTITIFIKASTLFISIKDDGQGVTKNEKGIGGRGMRTMKKRAEALNGKFELISGPGEGAEVKVTLPLPTTL